MTMTTRIDVARYQSPIGKLSLAMVDGKLVHLDFENNDDRLHIIQTRRFKNVDWHEGGVAPKSVTDWLDSYFAGRLMPLPMDDVRMIGTDFQKSAWDALIAIPSGESRSYAGQADILGNPKAVRAVARANALNPVHCALPPGHRIGRDFDRLCRWA
jgi:methylated-DNA-[protein]-cysteine S-methyltransferase